MSQDTDELAVKWARVNAKVLEQQAREEREKKEAEQLGRLVDRRNGYWIAAGIFFGVAVGLSILHWTRVMPVPAGVISWLGPGLTVISLLGGIATQVSINHRRTAKKIEDVRGELREEIRDARPADAIELGRLVALHLETQAMVEHNERQRQADFDMIRENSRKALEGIYQEVERLGPRVVEHVLAAVREWLPGAVEEAVRKGHAAGYVAGVQQRLNGAGAAVLPLHKP